MRQKYSEYMHWAKTASRARFNLATSGVGAFPLHELGELPALEINGDNSYGYAPLKAAIAQRHHVDADCVVTAAGTSGANYLAFATLLNEGDEVLLEHPAYGLLEDALRSLGAEVKHFPRAVENGYALDPAAVRRAISPKTKLIVVTNLHNPSSVLTPDSVLDEIGGIARSVGATVLVDEVYLDAVYEDTPRTSFHLGPEFVVTSSLTKMYGVSGLRCGWILTRPDLARAMWRMNDVMAATPVHPGELLSVAVFQNLEKLRDRFRRLVTADRHELALFLDRTPQVSAARTGWGTTCFLRMANGDADGFLERLRAERETSAVPGRFFGMPECFRIGMGVNSAMFAEGLRRLEEALKSGVPLK
jgi:aspartate/methionine/tyrosine aminotransferase